eukprot:Polyplicarium_translucidae@DN1361_c0_g1_i2.p2
MRVATFATGCDSKDCCVCESGHKWKDGECVACEIEEWCLADASLGATIDASDGGFWTLEKMCDVDNKDRVDRGEHPLCRAVTVNDFRQRCPWRDACPAGTIDCAPDHAGVLCAKARAWLAEFLTNAQCTSGVI